MTKLIFYTTDGCHLCEQAAALLDTLQESADIQVDVVDISTDTALVTRYGIRIPVVKNATSEEELGWPFQLSQLADLI